MTIQIGRFGSDITLGNPTSITRSLGIVTITGWAVGTNAIQLAALIQQCNGLAHPDEQGIPLIYTYDTSYQGWYKVLSAKADIDPNWDRLFRFRYTVELELLGHTATIESILSGAERTGSPVPLTPVYWVASPSTQAHQSVGTTIHTHARSIGALGSVSIYIATDFTNAYLTSQVPVASHYKGAAVFKSGLTTPYTQIGRQVTNTPTSWSLSNGCVTVGPPATSAYALKMSFTTAAGNAPTVSHDVEIGYITVGPVWNTFTLGTPTSIESLRNSPEEQVIRLSWENGAFTLDVSLRRGDRGVKLHWIANTSSSSGVAQSQLWGMAWRASAAFSTITADNIGLVETGFDADINRRVLVSVDTGTLVATGQGRFWANAATSRSAFFGVQVDSVDTADTAASLQDNYCAVQSERQRIVAVR